MSSAELPYIPQRVRYSRTEAAQALCISPRQLDRLRERGDIIGRADGGRIFFDHDELVSYAKSRPIAEAQRDAKPRRSPVKRSDEEAEMQAWVAKQLENCPPLSERQKQLIRAVFAEQRAQKEAKARRTVQPPI
ncbi:hypothetical protein [Nocardia farcinica]|uniref:hypothetical protein n=1 Tax=Nocardia farcinica TaxID=37329 RepID=UPI0018940315|nr:hypothetical protein [Nocardia farcinica]MBF6189509.1 hypothetical protein [Nocardia farcinica]MBF6363189.1 hypothetical protein [Nocardia farcinica]